MIRPILTYTIGAANNPPVLQEETRKVTDFHSEEVVTCIQDLTDTLDDFISRNGNKRGISGLSATQIGKDLAISVVRTNDNLYIMINPVVIDELGQNRLFRIGCFSLFEYRALVHYNDDIVIEYFDENGTVHHEEFKGDQSCVMQHEIDHLHGWLLFERLPNKEKDLFLPNALSEDDPSIPAVKRYSGLFNDYSDYRSFVEAIAPKYDKLADAVSKHTPKNGSILEIGDNTGTLSILLAKEGFKMTCAQINRDMMDLDARIAESNNVSVKYIQIDDLSNTSHYDTIILSDQLMNADNKCSMVETEKLLSLCNCLIFAIHSDTNDDKNNPVMHSLNLLSLTISRKMSTVLLNDSGIQLVVIQ
ncbi:MAG: peptide deformylase [Oscillospiraceae bacterium]|nr:peptide deformylase [Oscillospiraceae bacterium]